MGRTIVTETRGVLVEGLSMLMQQILVSLMPGGKVKREERCGWKFSRMELIGSCLELGPVGHGYGRFVAGHSSVGPRIFWCLRL